MPTNGKPVQERKVCRDCQSDEFGEAHAADQDQRKSNSRYGEDKTSGQVEAFLAGELPAQHRQSGAGRSIGEKTGGGGKRGVPAEGAYQCERPEQNGKGNNRDVRCLVAGGGSRQTSGESRLLGESKSQAWVGDHVTLLASLGLSAMFAQDLSQVPAELGFTTPPRTGSFAISELFRLASS
jgi:hypothetical protein